MRGYKDARETWAAFVRVPDCGSGRLEVRGQRSEARGQRASAGAGNYSLKCKQTSESAGTPLRENCQDLRHVQSGSTKGAERLERKEQAYKLLDVIVGQTASGQYNSKVQAS
jgi:hypothetical protein